MKKLFVSIMMAFAMVFAYVITPFSFPSAKADVNSTPVYDTVYYVSDNDHATTYRQSLLANTQIDPRITNIEVYLGDEESTFKDVYDEFLLEANPNEEQYLILELSNGFEPTTDSDDITVLPEHFKETLDDFADWQVLFICGTDETRWLEYNDFLQYVDYHINTDMMTTFFLDISHTIEQEINVGAETITFLFDSFFSQDENNNGVLYGWFFEEYFIPFFEEYGDMNQYQTMQDFFQAIRVQVVCHNGTSFKDGFTGQTITDLESVLDASEFVYAIGSSYGINNDEEVSTWVDMIQTLRTDMAKTFPIYVFDYSATYEDALDDNFFVIYQGGSVYYHIVDFLTPDADVSLYYFWSGACTNTHKHCIIPGEGGWITDVYGVFGYYIEGLAIYDRM